MAPPGRNAPCPCGSGLKFKRCCALGFTADEMRSALFALERAMIEMPPAEADRLTALYYGPSGNGPGSHRGDDACFIDWLYFDARDSKGTSLVDVVLRSSRLSRGERAFLTMMRGTAMCLYELVRPAPGIIKLREVFSREELLMNEEFLALSSRDTGLVLARIAPDSANGWPEIVGPLFEFPSTLRGELVSRLKTAVDAFRAAHPQSPVIEAHTLSPLVLRYQWRPAPPEPQPVPLGLPRKSGHFSYAAHISASRA